MKKEEAATKCCICCEDIEEKNKAKLDCCVHAYCFPCIHEWTSKCESSCPLCKRTVKTITHKDEILGKEIVIEVENLK